MGQLEKFRSALLSITEDSLPALEDLEKSLSSITPGPDQDSIYLYHKLSLIPRSVNKIELLEEINEIDKTRSGN